MLHFNKNQIVALLEKDFLKCIDKPCKVLGIASKRIFTMITEKQFLVLKEKKMLNKLIDTIAWK